MKPKKDRIDQVIAQLRIAALKEYAETYRLSIKKAQRFSTAVGIPEPYRDQCLEHNKDSTEIFLILSYCRLPESHIGMKVNQEVIRELKSLLERHTQKSIAVIAKWVATDPEQKRTAREIEKEFWNILNAAGMRRHQITMKQIEKRAKERRNKIAPLAAAMELGHKHFNTVCENLIEYLEVIPKQKQRPESNYSNVVDEYERLDATGEYSHLQILKMLYKNFIPSLDKLAPVEAKRLKKNLRQGIKDEQKRRERNETTAIK